MGWDLGCDLGFSRTMLTNSAPLPTQTYRSINCDMTTCVIHTEGTNGQALFILYFTQCNLPNSYRREVLISLFYRRINQGSGGLSTFVAVTGPESVNTGILHRFLFVPTPLSLSVTLFFRMFPRGTSVCIVYRAQNLLVDRGKFTCKFTIVSHISVHAVHSVITLLNIYQKCISA